MTPEQLRADLREALDAGDRRRARVLASELREATLRGAARKGLRSASRRSYRRLPSGLFAKKGLGRDVPVGGKLGPHTPKALGLSPGGKRVAKMLGGDDLGQVARAERDTSVFERELAEPKKLVRAKRPEDGWRWEPGSPGDPRGIKPGGWKSIDTGKRTGGIKIRDPRTGKVNTRGERKIEATVSKREFEYDPVPFDRFHPSGNIEPGRRVRIAKLPMTPPPGTMGQYHVADADSGEFLGMVAKGSLKPVGKEASPGDPRGVNIFSQDVLRSGLQGELAATHGKHHGKHAKARRKRIERNLASLNSPGDPRTGRTDIPDEDLAVTKPSRLQRAEADVVGTLKAMTSISKIPPAAPGSDPYLTRSPGDPRVPRMSQGGFEVVAASIRAMPAYRRAGLAEFFATQLAATNSRFNHDRFVAAATGKGGPGRGTAKLSRQHFEYLADIAKSLPEEDRGLLVRELGDRLSGTNPHFDRSRWEGAAGASAVNADPRAGERIEDAGAGKDWASTHLPPLTPLTQPGAPGVSEYSPKVGGKVVVNNGGTYEGKAVEVVKIEDDGSLIVKHPKGGSNMLRLKPGREVNGNKIEPQFRMPEEEYSPGDPRQWSRHEDVRGTVEYRNGEYTITHERRDVIGARRTSKRADYWHVALRGRRLDTVNSFDKAKRYAEDDAANETASPGDPRDQHSAYTLQDLDSLPTLATGQTDSLKIDTGTERVWLARTGVTDGEPYNNRVTVEHLRDGRWEAAYSYEAIDPSDSTARDVAQYGDDLRRAYPYHDYGHPSSEGSPGDPANPSSEDTPVDPDDLVVFDDDNKLGWEPGMFGRGTLDVSGQVHTWPEDDATHEEYMYEHDLHPRATFLINSKGEAMLNYGETNKDAIAEIEAADPRIRFKETR